ncbi:hypothetical protein [Haloplanus sp. C73]|uniref:hypothetical protein n=1 Tax=Haloplanus sp. C73 TaxID=3421641 RepID=UPI003EB6DF3A
MLTDEAEHPFSEEEYLNEIQKEYREKTGQELPDHVLENYVTFFSLGPGPEALREAFKNGQRVARGQNNTRQRTAPLIDITINWPFGGNDGN